MLTPEHFEIPLEKQLKMRVIYDEVDQCTNVEALQENLKATAEQLMKYQHLISTMLKEQIMAELDKWDVEATKIVKESASNEDDTTRRLQN